MHVPRPFENQSILLALGTRPDPVSELFERFPCTGANMYGLVEDIALDDGWAYAPTEPGLGYAIDWARLKREQTATLE
jgi:hypothetical protein